MAERSHDALVAWASGVAPDYRPNADVLNVMVPKRTVTVSGASGVGKDSIIRTAIAKYTDLHGVVGLTSRERRMENGAWEVPGIHYHFERDSDGLRQAIEKGELVQVAVPKTGKAVYGSRPEAYKDGKINVVDVAAATALAMAGYLPDVGCAYIVPPSRKVLEARLDRRGPLTPESRKQRTTEAVSSMTIGLEEGSPFQCIINKEGAAGDAAGHLYEVARYGSYDEGEEAAARKVGRTVLRELQSVLGLPRTFGGFYASPHR